MIICTKGILSVQEDVCGGTSLTCSSVSGSQYIHGAALVLRNRSSNSLAGGSSGLSTERKLMDKKKNIEQRIIHQRRYLAKKKFITWQAIQCFTHCQCNEQNDDYGDWESNIGVYYMCTFYFAKQLQAENELLMLKQYISPHTFFLHLPLFALPSLLASPVPVA